MDFYKKYGFWFTLLIVCLPVWVYFSVFSVFLFDSGESAWAYVAAGSIWIVGPCSLVCLFMARVLREQNPRRALFILRLPFWYALILTIVFVGLLAYEEVRAINTPRPTEYGSVSQPSATPEEAHIDISSLAASNFDGTPTIKGTAQGLTMIRLIINTESGVTAAEANVSVTDGTWSYTIPENRKLQPRTYDVVVSNMSGEKLDQGKLLIHSYGG